MTRDSHAPLAHRDAERYRASLPPEAYARLVEATSGSTRSAGHFVVLARQSSSLPDAEGLGRAAEALGLDPYTTRQRWLSPAPRILRREPTREAAEREVERLRAAGLRAFRLSERAFFQFHPVRVASVRSGHGLLDLTVLGGRSETVEPGDLLCAVRGTVRVKRGTEEEQRRLFGLGGIIERGILHQSAEDVVDLHLRRLPVIFRVFHGDLVNHPGGTPGMARLMADLECDFPAATRITNFDQAEAIIGQNRHITSRVVEFDYRLMGMPTAHGQQVDSTSFVECGFEAFDLFSLLTRMQLLRA